MTTPPNLETRITTRINELRMSADHLEKQLNQHYAAIGELEALLAPSPAEGVSPTEE